MLDSVDRVMFFHAHPDDETLLTGALIAALSGRGVEVAVVTATRGERGEVAPGPWGELDGAALARHREVELARALRDLGVQVHGFLGDPPALAPGRTRRRWVDSGMAWLESGLAGPAADSDPDALSVVEPAEPVEDLLAFLRWFSPDRLITYDRHGGYGHPDHVACHRIALAAAAIDGVRCLEVVSDSLLGQARTDASFLDLQRWEPQVVQALGRFGSQLRMSDGRILHVGGQLEQVRTSLTLQAAVEL